MFTQAHVEICLVQNDDRSECIYIMYINIHATYLFEIKQTGCHVIS